MPVFSWNSLMWVMGNHVVYLFVVYITVSLLFLMSSVRSSVVYDICCSICCSISVLNMILPSLWNIFFSEFLYKIKVVKDLYKVFSLPDEGRACKHIQNRNSAINWLLGWNWFPWQKKKFPGIVVEIWSQLGGQYRKWVVDSSQV